MSKDKKNKKSQASKAEKKDEKNITAEEEKMNDSILNEVLSIAGKSTANEDVSVEKKVDEPQPLAQTEAQDSIPEGWRKTEVVRKSGKTAGQIDVYYFSPDNTKLRSRPEVAAYLRRTNSKVTIEQFDFRKKSKRAATETTEESCENDHPNEKTNEEVDVKKEDTEKPKKTRRSQCKDEDVKKEEPPVKAKKMAIRTRESKKRSKK